MATLSRKFLAGLGIEEEKADLILEEHQKVVSEVKTERDDYKEKAEQYDEVQRQLDELKSKSSDEPNEELLKAQQELADLQAEYSQYKEQVEQKETQSKKEAALRKLLKDAGVSDKYLDILLKAASSELDSIEFDDDGTVKDGDSKVEKFKKDYSDFVVNKGTDGVPPATPPGSNGAGAAPSRAAELFKKHSAEMYGNTNPKEE